MSLKADAQPHTNGSPMQTLDPELMAFGEIGVGTLSRVIANMADDARERDEPWAGYLADRLEEIGAYIASVVETNLLTAEREVIAQLEDQF